MALAVSEIPEDSGQGRGGLWVTSVRATGSSPELLYLSFFFELQDYIYTRCVRILGDEPAAEEAVCSAFDRGLASLDQLHNRPSKTWIVRIAINCCLDMLRKRSRYPTTYADNKSLGEVLVSPLLGTEELAISAIIGVRLREEIAQLPIQQGRVVALALAGYSGVEISALLAVSPQAISKLRAKAYMTLHRRMESWR
jgi:RNA polymerase sigma-70 factor (ECF subfamily)